MPPLNSPKRLPPPAESKLGAWQDGTFKFSSPEAEQRWAIEAYRNGVSATNWHQGTPIDDKTRDVVLSGLGGATPPVFRGPDGQYRYANIHTVEPQDVRDHRSRAFRGVRLENLTGPEMPGEDVIAARYAKPAPQQVAVNDNATPASAIPKTGIGRFAAMAAAQKAAAHPSLPEVLQHIDDGVRLLANGATLGFADNIAAAGNAVFGSGSFGEDYDKNLAAEKALTKAAQDRSGVIGALVESAPQFIPGAGDALGVGNDIKMYLNDPSQRTWKNFGLTALGALPFVPSVAGSIKRVDDAIETAAKIDAKAADKINDAPAQALDPHETRFSQATISYQKTGRTGGKSYTYDDIQRSMQEEGWKGAPIDVVRMPDGKLTSLDNTRLLAARSAGIPVQARVHDFNDSIPRREAKRIRGLDGENSTWGQAVEKRLSTQFGRFGEANPNGSLNNPRLTRRPQKNAEQ